ncbi:MAG: hypothetical protein K2X38_18995 [Gemmataceae bacterium]|nr:hypothetical protein [Gemmataceae bacterium]
MRQGIAVFGCLLVAAATVHAQDQVLVKGKKAVNGNIATENVKGVTFKSGDFFAGDDVDDIIYELNAKNTPAQTTQTNIAYRGARDLEKASLEGKEGERKAKIASAIKEYADVSAKVTDKLIKRHLEYKAVALRARQASEDGLAPEAAVKQLVAYAGKNSSAWQSVQALKTAARIAQDLGDFPQTEAIYLQLAEMDLSPDLKLDYELQSALVSVQSGKFDAAMKKLKALETKMPKGSRQAVRAQVAQAECLANAKKIDEAIAMVKPILKDVTDKAGKAAAYNTLGYCYFQKEDFKQARWEFLWVDVVYNQDRKEHAKALYYLTQTFEKMNEPEKAQECREALLGDKAFAGTEWVRKLQKAAPKTP